MTNRLIKILHTLGGIFVLAGAAFQFFEFGIAKYIFSAGVLVLIGVQSSYLSKVRNENIRIQRIGRMMFFVTLLLGLAAYLMFTKDDRWVILILIYALVSFFLGWRSATAEEKSKK